MQHPKLWPHPACCVQAWRLGKSTGGAEGCIWGSGPLMLRPMIQAGRRWSTAPSSLLPSSCGPSSTPWCVGREHNTVMDGEGLA
jgi:hypothetical protein